MPRLTSAFRRDTCTEVSRVSRSAGGLAISWSSWCCYWAHRRQWERKSRSLFRTSRWGTIDAQERLRGLPERLRFPELALSGEEDLHWRLNAGIAKCEGGDRLRAGKFHFGSDSAWSWCGAIACLPNRTARSKHLNGIAVVRPSNCLASTSPLDQLRNQQELVSVCAKRSLKPPSATVRWVGE